MTVFATLTPAQGTSFRASLTSTVAVVEADLDRHAGTGPAPVTGAAAPRPDSIACRQVFLRWNALPSATRYTVYVSPTRSGPWIPLPTTNACGTSRSAGPTSVTDPQPITTGGERTLHYKVIALGGPGGTRVLDATTVLPVTLRTPVPPPN
jgi:hypothetical protein